jgi:tetratricopeptide (TPR) repeat protein
VSAAHRGGPDVFFLPLCVQDKEAVRRAGGAAPEMLARRIPDFVHQLLNRLDATPTGMLEVQTPPEEGPVRWVDFEEVPEPAEAFELLPEEEEPRAIVTGAIEAATHGLTVTLWVHFAADLDSGVSTQVRAVLTRTDPIHGARRLAEHLAKVLELPFVPLASGLLTRNGRAFLKFLEGLDNAALISGDLAIENDTAVDLLMRPFCEALELDPGFGLALRVAHATLADAVSNARADAAECRQVLEACFSAQPSDGDACVQVAEQLVGLGDDEGAIRWLRHATHLDPPPPKGLENLGIMMANKGQISQAKELWIQGASLDGHPDFYAHLARLEFSEDQKAEAWRQILNGLRRLRERASRAAEWDEDGRGAGVLLRYLVEHLEEEKAHPGVAESLVGLTGLFTLAEDRVDLALCLIAISRDDLARIEIHAALSSEIEPSVRDLAVRALLALDVPDFERRFRRAVDQVVGGKGLRHAVSVLERFLAVQPAFWPALFFAGIARQRLGEEERAVDTMAEVLRLRPGQPDALNELGVLFDRRGNSKRALECIEHALESRPEDVQFIANKALALAHLGRHDEAREALREALQIAPADPDLKRLWRDLED